MEEEQELHITFLDDDDNYEKGDIICVSFRRIVTTRMDA